MGMDYIRSRIDNDIDYIRSSYHEDVSQEIVTFLTGFVSHYNHYSPLKNLFKDVFIYDIKGLEKSIEEKTKKSILLDYTTNAGFEICRILQQNNNSEELEELKRYLKELVTK